MENSKFQLQSEAQRKQLFAPPYAACTEHNTELLQRDKNKNQPQMSNFTVDSTSTHHASEMSWFKSYEENEIPSFSSCFKTGFGVKQHGPYVVLSL